MNRPASSITDLVIHSSATKNGQHLALLEIDGWHWSRGFKRSVAAVEADPRRLRAIGYHRLIQPSGTVEQGREFAEVGSHAPRPEDVDGLPAFAAEYPGNSRSIGVCLVGTDKFTLAQWNSLRDEVVDLMGRFPIKRVWSHNHLTTAKTCPCFDARAWLESGMVPVTGCVI